MLYNGGADPDVGIADPPFVHQMGTLITETY